MSDKDELARLRGEIAALSDALVAAIRSARAMDPTSDRPGTPNAVGATIRKLDSKLSGRAAVHVNDVIFGETEEGAAYADKIEEIKQALRRV